MSERSTKKMMKNDDLDESHDGDIDTAIFQLELVHIELEKLNDRENEEILTIEQKYKKMRQHHFDKRGEIIETIPDYWFNVFTSHPDICHLLHEDEEDCLHYLKKVEIETAENIKSGYGIKLYFNENPFFKNDVLIKEFFYRQTDLCSVSSKIDWNKPHPAFPANNKDAPGCSKGRKRSLQVPKTFFGWFADNEDACNDVIAEIIKDDIWPNSLQYYLVPDPDVDGNDDSSDTSDSDESGFDINSEKTSLQRLAGEGTSK